MIRWFEKHNALSWAITILIAVFIFSFSTITFEGFGGGEGVKSWMSIAYHVIVFFFLSLFLFISLIKGKNTNLFFPSILVLLSYAILDEIHQFFVQGRFCTLADVGFDLIGVLFAFMVYFISLKSKEGYTKSTKTLKDNFSLVK